MKKKIFLETKPVISFYDSRTDSLYTFENESQEVVNGIKQTLKRLQKYNIGIKIINFFSPRIDLIWFLIFLSFIYSLIAAFPVLYSVENLNNTNNFGTALLSSTKYVAIIFIVITALQYTIYNNLESVSSLDFSHLQMLSSLISIAQMKRVHPRHISSFKQWENFNVLIESNRLKPTHNLSKKEIRLFISVKNISFTKELVTFYINKLSPQFKKSTIVLVSDPYKENLKVDYSGPQLSEKLNNLEEINNSKKIMVQNLLSKSINNNVTIIEWSSLEKKVDARIRNEIARSIEKKDSLFRRDCLAMVLNINGINASSSDKYLGFLLCELPVLIYSYYSEGIVDCYPGENAIIFKKLEERFYVNDLPFTTELAEKKNLIYIRIEKS